MSKKRRTFSTEEKHSILQEAEREGILETCRKYNLSASLLRYWRNKFLSNGIDGLKAGYRKTDPRLKELERENLKLKSIIAKQALEIEFKDELIKKGQAHLRKEGRLS